MSIISLRAFLSEVNMLTRRRNDCAEMTLRISLQVEMELKLKKHIILKDTINYNGGISSVSVSINMCLYMHFRVCDTFCY